MNKLSIARIVKAAKATVAKPPVEPAYSAKDDGAKGRAGADAEHVPPDSPLRVVRSLGVVRCRRPSHEGTPRRGAYGSRRGSTQAAASPISRRWPPAASERMWVTKSVTHGVRLEGTEHGGRKDRVAVAADIFSVAAVTTIPPMRVAGSDTAAYPMSPLSRAPSAPLLGPSLPLWHLTVVAAVTARPPVHVRSRPWPASRRAPCLPHPASLSLASPRHCSLPAYSYGSGRRDRAKCRSGSCIRRGGQRRRCSSQRRRGGAAVWMERDWMSS